MISTHSAREDGDRMDECTIETCGISTHSAREDGDGMPLGSEMCIRDRTYCDTDSIHCSGISTHSAREDGDLMRIL